MKAKVNEPNTNQVLITKVKQGDKENLPKTNEVQLQK